MVDKIKIEVVESDVKYSNTDLEFTTTLFFIACKVDYNDIKLSGQYDPSSFLSG